MADELERALLLRDLELMAQPRNPNAVQPGRAGLLDIGVGLQERLGLLNQMFNPVEAIGQSMAAGREMMAPNASGYDRMASLGDMLSGVAGVVAPVAAGARAGAPAATSLMEGLLGGSPDNIARFAADEAGSLPGMGIGLPAPRTDAEAMARDILQLRAEGRADEVTDQMMAAADPQYMYSNTPLPMDYASRMGRAIQEGFDVNDEMYRGDAPRQSFDTGRGQREQIGVTGSNIPDVAASYIPARGEGGIYPLVSRGQNDAVIEAGGQNWNVILPNTPVQFQGDRSRLDEYIPIDQYFEPYDVQAGTAFFDTNDLSRIFQSYGADRVRFNDLVDRGSSAKYYGPQSSSPSNVTMVSNPANIRSRFARFDPEFRHLSNLSASLAAAGVPLGLLAMQPEQEQY